jgi:translation initiation factor IF-2
MYGSISRRGPYPLPGRRAGQGLGGQERRCAHCQEGPLAPRGREGVQGAQQLPGCPRARPAWPGRRARPDPRARAPGLGLAQTAPDASRPPPGAHPRPGPFQTSPRACSPRRGAHALRPAPGLQARQVGTASAPAARLPTPSAPKSSSPAGARRPAPRPPPGRPRSSRAGTSQSRHGLPGHDQPGGHHVAQPAAQAGPQLPALPGHDTMATCPEPGPPGRPAFGCSRRRRTFRIPGRQGRRRHVDLGVRVADQHAQEAPPGAMSAGRPSRAGPGGPAPV